MAPNQLDLICGDCPLRRCDTGSLWCVFRLLTVPNKQQRAAMILAGNQRKATAKRKQEWERKRQQIYYEANKERKLAAARGRYRTLANAKHDDHIDRLNDERTR